MQSFFPGNLDNPVNHLRNRHRRRIHQHGILGLGQRRMFAVHVAVIPILNLFLDFFKAALLALGL